MIKRFSISIPEILYNRIEFYKDDKLMSRSRLVQEAVKKYMDEEDVKNYVSRVREDNEQMEHE